MAVVTDLDRLSKGELIQMALDQQRKIQSLEQEVQRLHDRLNPPKKSRFSLALLRPRPKPPGAKPGHPGWFRAKPRQIDRVVEQTLQTCPDCHARLGPSVEVTEHVQEDLIPARVEATRFRRHRYYCPGCRKMVTAPYASEEIPHSDWGPHILTHAVLFKYVHGSPFNKIRTAFAQLAGLTVSEGGLAEALQRLARWLNVEAQELLKAVRASPAVHVDETGWKLNGINHWLWAFVTEKLAYYRIDPSRGSAVPKAVLTDRFRGTVIRDFFSAYNRLKVPQQKCWAHLLRELREGEKKDPSEEYRRAHRSVRRIFLDARRLSRARRKLPATTVLHRYGLLSERLLAWGASPYRSKTLKRLSERVLKHHHQLLTFLKQPKVPMDNNHAERWIRPHVIIRKRSYQSRSPTGVLTHAHLMSLVETLALQRRAIGETIRSAYLRHRQGDLRPVILSNN